MTELIQEQTRWQKVLASVRTSFWGAGIIASVLGAQSLGAFQALEFLVFDRYFAFRTQFFFEREDKDITIVQIDEPYVASTTGQDDLIETNRLVQLLAEILAEEPVAVGLDIAPYRITGSNQKDLLDLITAHPNLITIEADDTTGSTSTLSDLSQEQLDSQVGFNTLLFDKDGFVRRSLLGFSPTGGSENYKTSFALQLVKQYFLYKQALLKARIQELEQEKEQLLLESPLNSAKTLETYERTIEDSYQELNSFDLNNGTKDIETIRFGSLEVPRIPRTSETPKLLGLNNSYSYNSEEIYGLQGLVNYRAAAEPFTIVNASELTQSPNQRNFVSDRIVLLGLVGSAQEFPTPLTKASSPTLPKAEVVTGTEIQAHIISQIVQAVELGRPLIKTNRQVQYFFFFAFSVLGISCGQISKNTGNSFLALLLVIFLSIFLSCFAFILLGLWLPLAATLVSTTANGLIYINYMQNKRRWEQLIQQLDVALDKERHLSEKLKLDRQKTVHYIFDSIHNGPLQTLASLLRRTRDQAIDLPDICLGLEDLDREIRYIGDSIKQDAVTQTENLEVSYAGTKFDLAIPLQELFQEVYDAMLSRQLDGFSMLKIKAISFDSIDSETLSIDVKRKLCRFLEEALVNVGKHAIGATRLTVTGKLKGNQYELTISDNGPGLDNVNVVTGTGTLIGKETEELTRGKFIRRPNKPKGLYCQLTFPLNV